MARPRRSEPLDLAAAVDLTTGAIERLACPEGRDQAFLRDAKAPGLKVRVTPAGAKSFVFEAKLNRQNIRRTIGDVRAWTIEVARAEARRLRVTLDGGDDPRELERQQQAQREAQAAAEAARLEADKREAVAAALTVGEVWREYLEARRPHWGELHYQDHIKLAREGGKVVKRGTDGRGVTIAMPLHALMGLPLRRLDAATIEAWAAKEAKTRPTSTRLAWRQLKVFLNWCAEQPEYAGLLPASNAASTRKTRDALGKPKAKTDVLLREQLPAWFMAVRAITNPTISAAIQAMLLTGARPGEVLAMRWEDVNEQWRGITIRDKVEGERVIPLTPYVAQLLAGLPRRNAFVFSSRTAKGGAVTLPRNHHVCACKTAGIEGLTLHGLRRSFKSLTEWLEVPAGVVAQIQGHKPSATAEKHYTVRPLDMLRLHHERIETAMLEWGAVPFVPAVEPARLRMVQ